MSLSKRAYRNKKKDDNGLLAMYTNLHCADGQIECLTEITHDIMTM